MEHFSKEKLEKYVKRSLNYEDDYVLLGVQMLANSTKDSFYREHIEKYLLKNPVERFELQNINEGKVLFDLYSETKEEKYKKSLDSLYELLKTSEISYENFHATLPFCMRYETEFNGKQGYFEIYNHFMVMREKMFHEEKGIYLEKGAMHLMALIDTLEYMSEEIFLEYRGLQIIFKEAVNGILKYEDEISQEELVILSYVLLKGTRLGFLNERYTLKGKKIFEKAYSQYVQSHDKKEWGQFLMACSEAFKI